MARGLWIVAAAFLAAGTARAEFKFEFLRPASLEMAIPAKEGRPGRLNYDLQVVGDKSLPHGEITIHVDQTIVRRVSDVDLSSVWNARHFIDTTNLKPGAHVLSASLVAGAAMIATNVTFRVPASAEGRAEEDSVRELFDALQERLKADPDTEKAMQNFQRDFKALPTLAAAYQQFMGRKETRTASEFLDLMDKYPEFYDLVRDYAGRAGGEEMYEMLSHDRRFSGLLAEIFERAKAGAASDGGSGGDAHAVTPLDDEWAKQDVQLPSVDLFVTSGKSNVDLAYGYTTANADKAEVDVCKVDGVCANAAPGCPAWSRTPWSGEDKKNATWKPGRQGGGCCFVYRARACKGKVCSGWNYKHACFELVESSPN
ncbi:MAG: hypothetical protein HY925_00310 [Elusimicrobia bacterium]|nr:hypothetical protein [Elusimicrobiota bacterium]